MGAAAYIYSFWKRIKGYVCWCYAHMKSCCLPSMYTCSVLSFLPSFWEVCQSYFCLCMQQKWSHSSTNALIVWKHIIDIQVWQMWRAGEYALFSLYFLIFSQWFAHMADTLWYFVSSFFALRQKKEMWSDISNFETLDHEDSQRNEKIWKQIHLNFRICSLNLVISKGWSFNF